MKLNRFIWIIAALSFLLQLYLTQFFQFGAQIPLTNDINPGNYHDAAFLWPPHDFFSTEYYLGFQSAAPLFDPVALLAHLPVWLFFTFFFPLFATLGFFACYKLLRELEFSPAISCFSALAFSWGEDLLNSLLPGHFPNPVLWAIFPFTLFLVLRSNKTSGWFLAAVAGAFTGLMVSLFPDRGGICSLLIGGFFIVSAVLEKRRGVPQHSLLRFFLMIVIAFIIASPAFLAIIEPNVSNIKSPGNESVQDKWNWCTQWSFSPEDTLTYFVPGLLGWHNGSGQGEYWGRIGQSAEWPQAKQGFRNFCLGSFSTGTLPTLFAFLGCALLFRRKSTSAEANLFTNNQRLYGRFFCVSAAVFYLLALGKYGPLYYWFFQIPMMDHWRNPVKFLMPMNLSLIILSAYGLRYLSTLIQDVSHEKERIFIRRFLFFLATLFCCLWFLSLFFSLSIANYMKASLSFSLEEISDSLSAFHWSLFMAAAMVSILALGWNFLLHSEKIVIATFPNPFIQKIWRSALQPSHLGISWIVLSSFLTVFHLFWVQSHFIHPYDYQNAYASNPFIQKLIPTEENPFRVEILMDDPLLYQDLSSVFPYYGIDSIDISAISRMPRDYADFFETLGSNPLRLYQLSGVRYLACPHRDVSKIEALDGLKANIASVHYYPLQATVLSNDESTYSHAIVELKNDLPKVTFISSLEILETPQKVLERLKDPQWDFRKTILIDQKEAGALPSFASLNEGKIKTPVSSTAVIRLIHYNKTQIQIEVDAPQAGYLLINDRFDENWKVLLNGDPTNIFHADFIYRGIAVPAGKSTILMNYEAGTILVSLIYLTMIVWSILALIALGRWLFKRST